MCSAVDISHETREVFILNKTQEFALLTAMIMIIGLVLFYKVLIKSYSKSNFKSLLIELHATARIINFGTLNVLNVFVTDMNETSNKEAR